MPPTGSNGGGGNSWDSENNLFNADQNWLPPSSTSDSSFTCVEAQNQNTGVSVVDHSGAGRNASLDASHHFNFDFHQVQPRPAAPASKQAPASAGALPVNTGCDWRSFFDSTGSTLGITNTGDETFKRPASGQTSRRSQNTSSSQTSPTDSLPSASSLLSTNVAAPRSTPSEHTKKPVSKLSKATSMNSKTLQTPKTSQIISNNKIVPGTSKFSTMKRTYTASRTLEVDEDARRGQAGRYTRGGSLVSSTSGLSRGEVEAPKSEIADDENSRRYLIQENRGAGKTPGVLRSGPGNDGQNGQFPLPPGKGFPIQIGSELFRLSGASIMSDGQYNFRSLGDDVS